MRYEHVNDDNAHGPLRKLSERGLDGVSVQHRSASLFQSSAQTFKHSGLIISEQDQGCVWVRPLGKIPSDPKNLSQIVVLVILTIQQRPDVVDELTISLLETRRQP